MAIEPLTSPGMILQVSGARWMFVGPSKKVEGSLYTDLGIPASYFWPHQSAFLVPKHRMTFLCPG